jgi:hypothetical protein
MSLGFLVGSNLMRLHKVIESVVAQEFEVRIFVICTEAKWCTLEEECKDHDAEREGFIFIG